MKNIYKNKESQIHILTQIKTETRAVKFYISGFRI